jgi:hypothetical protein
MPSSRRPNSMNARWQLTGVLGGIVLAAASCATLAPRTPATMTADRGWSRTIAGAPIPTGHVTRDARQHAADNASRLLASALLPPDSHPVAKLPGRALDQPAQLEGCNPLEDAGRLWLTPEAPAAVTAFLTGHVPAGTTNSVRGGSTLAGRPTSFVVVDDVARRSPDGKLADTGAELVFTFARVGSLTGVRVDAITVPPGAACLSGGGGQSAGRRQR